MTAKTLAQMTSKDVVIILGQPKAGTTSLFNWLTAHPDVTGSIVKETRFFLDNDYPLPAGKRFDGENIGAYFDFFPATDARILLEASPDYLYCETPATLGRILPNARFIIIERDPVERLQSVFNYYKQQEMLPATLDFEVYIKGQFDRNDIERKDITALSLDQCRRSYISKYEDTYKDRCMVISFNDLKTQPEATLDRTCAFMGLEYAPIARLEATPKNKTKASRYPLFIKLFRPARRIISHSLLKSPKIRGFLRPISKMIQKAIYKDKQKLVIQISPELKALIHDETQK